MAAPALAPSLRREDPRLLRGGGRYVADIELPSMRYAAFVRSPVAHADVVGVELPSGVVGWTGEDLIGRIETMAPNEADGGVYQGQIAGILGR